MQLDLLFIFWRKFLRSGAPSRSAFFAAMGTLEIATEAMIEATGGDQRVRLPGKQFDLCREASRLHKLIAGGMSAEEAGISLGISRAKAFRLQKKAIEMKESGRSRYSFRGIGDLSVPLDSVMAIAESAETRYPLQEEEWALWREWLRKKHQAIRWTLKRRFTLMVSKSHFLP